MKFSAQDIATLERIARPGFSFSLKPVWPPGFVATPYVPPHQLHAIVAANLKKGRDNTNKLTGTKFYTVSKFDPAPLSPADQQTYAQRPAKSHKTIGA